MYDETFKVESEIHIIDSRSRPRARSASGQGSMPTSDSRAFFPGRLNRTIVMVKKLPTEMINNREQLFIPIEPEMGLEIEHNASLVDIYLFFKPVEVTAGSIKTDAVQITVINNRSTFVYLNSLYVDSKGTTKESDNLMINQELKYRKDLIAEFDKRVNSTYRVAYGLENSNISMAGRRVLTLPAPEYNSNGMGRVVVSITVNRSGQVIRARAGERGTTTSDRVLWIAAEAAALKARFEPQNNSPQEQSGTITYNFIRD
jgi:TonB family protein